MSAARFKSKDDYFLKRSGLTRKFIERKSLNHREKNVRIDLPVSLLVELFCSTVDTFELEGKGRFDSRDYPIELAVEQHLDGAETLRVNPLSHSGKTSWNVVRFVLSENLDHPFTKAKKFADELHAHSIGSMIEVTEGGKGDYHLWIFHEVPIDGRSAAEALNQFGRKLFGIELKTSPPVRGEMYVPLPLQGESLLFQRRVIVNSVGKMIKDQQAFLSSIERNTPETIEVFCREMDAEKRKIPVVDNRQLAEPPVEKEKTEKTVPADKIEAEKASIRASDTVTKIGIKQKKKSRLVSTNAATNIEMKSRSRVTMRVLVFTAAGKEYCLDSGSVESVLLPSEITQGPFLPDSVMGTAAVKGMTVAVLHAGSLLDGDEITIPGEARVILIKGEPACTGLLVDDLSSIQTAISITDGSPKKNRAESSFIEDYVKIDNRSVEIPLVAAESILAVAAPDKTGRGKESNDKRCVILTIAENRLGLPEDYVKEILSAFDVESISSPELNTDGVIRFGETYIPLVDLGEKLKIRVKDFAVAPGDEKYLVLKGKDRLFGIRADSIEGIRTIHYDSFSHAPASVQRQTPVNGYVNDSENRSSIMMLDSEWLAENG